MVTHDEGSLKQAMRHEKDADAALRMRVVYAVEYKGANVYKLADMLGIDPSAVYKWRKWFEERDIEGLRTDPRSGRPPLVSRNDVDETVIESVAEGHIRVSDLCKNIKDKFGLLYSLRQGRRFMSRNNQTPKRATKVYIHREELEEVLKWQKSLRRKKRYRNAQGYTTLAIDQCFSKNEIIKSARLWGPKGKRNYQVSAGGHGTIAIHGAVTEDGQTVLELYDEHTTETTANFLNHLHDKFGPIFVILDRASSHTSPRLLELTKGRDIVLEFFRKGRPECNPVEAVWNILKSDDSISRNRHKRIGDRREHLLKISKTKNLSVNFNKIIFRMLEI